MNIKNGNFDKFGKRRISKKYIKIDEYSVQYLKNVKLSNELVIVGMKPGNEPIIARKIQSDFGYPEDIFMSDSVKTFSTKELKTISKSIVKAMKKMGIVNRKHLPILVIVGDIEMSASGLAAYDIRTNSIKIYYGLGDKKRWVDLMKGVAIPGNPIGTYVHELYHWIEAEKYIKQFGPIITIEDQRKYLDKMNTDGKEFVDKLIEDGYDVFEISEYASKSFIKGRYDEVRTEYRTKILLGG
ncbi:MAG: hypothetical protein J6E46_03340 [Faecalicoccus sp.]|nr:hypothetical protein [Faecalicoccus sp.]